MTTTGRNGTSDAQVRAGLPDLLPRLWRFGLVLTKDRMAAEDLVQATCLRALEKSDQFQVDTRLDRWAFSIMNSVWFNELRAQRVRRGQGIVDAEAVLASDGASELEMNIFANQVLTKANALPEAQRVAVYLVYVEGLTYREAASTMEVPIGTVMSRLAAARVNAGAKAGQRTGVKVRG